MSYHDVFELFWEQVKESAQEGRFDELTMANTICKPELENFVLRPIYSDDGFKVLLKFRYRSREIDDMEEEYTLDEALDILKSHLVRSFSSVLLFTTTKDATFKVNKKGAGSITEGLPTFREVPQAKSDFE